MPAKKEATIGMMLVVAALTVGGCAGGMMLGSLLAELSSRIFDYPLDDWGQSFLPSSVFQGVGAIAGVLVSVWLVGRITRRMRRSENVDDDIES